MQTVPKNHTHSHIHIHTILTYPHTWQYLKVDTLSFSTAESTIKWKHHLIFYHSSPSIYIWCTSIVKRFHFIYIFKLISIACLPNKHHNFNCPNAARWWAFSVPICIPWAAFHDTLSSSVNTSVCICWLKRYNYPSNDMVVSSEKGHLHYIP